MRHAPFALAIGLALTGCFEDSSTVKSTIVPKDYQTHFLLSRDCLPDTSRAHGQGYQLVRANLVAMQGPPYAEGSVFVSELYVDPGCDNLQGIYAMAKEKAGYDTPNSDWHYQRLSRLHQILEDGKVATCVTCHADCADSDRICSRR